MRDPYVEEVHKYRMEHMRQFDSDLHRICEDLREFEASLGERVVTLGPKKRQPRWSLPKPPSPGCVEACGNA
jgi:hypothetical protein